VDNHAINTVPKETLIRIIKAEAGGLDGKGIWKPATGGYSPAEITDQNQRYLAGGYIQIG
jgi:nitrate reductase alpha subunit